MSLEHSIRRQSSTPSQACPSTQHSCLCCPEQLTIHPWLSITCAGALAGVESAPHFPGPWGDHLSLETNSGLKSPQISWFPGLLCPPFLDRPCPPTPQTQPRLPRLAMTGLKLGARRGLRKGQLDDVGPLNPGLPDLGRSAEPCL